MLSNLSNIFSFNSKSFANTPLKNFEFQKQQDYFLNLKENEPDKIINKYKQNKNLLGIRNNMINWVKFLCTTLKFGIQTLFRATIIFDEYFPLIAEEENLNQNLLNLITIGCLSLATKLEENNSNYISFFTEKVLNLPNCAIFSVKDLAKIEISILKKLKYKTNYSTCVSFSEIFYKIYTLLKEFEINNNNKNYIKNAVENTMIEKITDISYIINTQSIFTFLCFKETIKKLNKNHNIILRIYNFLFDDKINLSENEDSLKKFNKRINNKEKPNLIAIQTL